LKSFPRGMESISFLCPFFAMGSGDAAESFLFCRLALGRFFRSFFVLLVLLVGGGAVFFFGVLWGGFFCCFYVGLHEAWGFFFSILQSPCLQLVRRSVRLSRGVVLTFTEDLFAVRAGFLGLAGGPHFFS